MGHLTVQQNDRLGEFRETLKSNDRTKDNLAKSPDVQLLRFLRAREFNIKKAMKMVEDDVDWRREIAGKKISIASFPSVIKFVENRLVRLGGKDKDGRPFLILRSGEMFPRQVKDVMEVVNFFIFYVENIKKYVDSCGFTEFTAIGDMSGWSLSENFSLPISQIMAQMLQDHYPECLRYAFVINNPWAFSAAWSLISPFLEERVKAKVHVWGSKREKLLDYIDADQLDKEMGGSRPEPYPSMDFITASVIKQKKLAVVALRPYDPIHEMTEAEAEQMLAAAGKGTAATSPTAGSPAAGAAMADSDGEDDSEDAAVVRDISQLKLDPNAKPARLKKKKSVRATLGRMFSLKSKKNAMERDADDLPGPEIPMSPITRENENRPVEVITKARPRVGVFGSTGKTGKSLIIELLEKGNDVTAFVRVNGQNRLPADLVKRSESNDPKRPRLQIVVGAINNMLDLERVVEDCDSVVSVLGTPPAMTGSDTEFLPGAVSKILDAMERLKVRRFVTVSSAHASQGWWEAGAGLLSNLTKPVYWKNHYQYIAQMEEEVKRRGAQGALDFTIVRPGLLTDGKVTKNIRAEEGFVFQDSGPGEISRGDLINFLVQEAVDFKAQSKWCNKGVAVGQMV